MSNFAITFSDVENAARTIAGAAVRTPVISSHGVNKHIGATVYLKAENLQRTGAFKFRGACNTVRSLDPAVRSRGVVAYSSGNHGQAVAAAAELEGTSAIIVMPHDAPEGKVAACVAHGATLVRYDRYTEDRLAIAVELVKTEGLFLIPPDGKSVMAGQGTAALELFEQVEEPLDALVVCLGGGGLLAGCATVASTVSPTTRLFGVEPAEGNDHQLSRAAGERITIDVPRTIADGQQTTAPGELTWPINNALVTDFLAVSDEEIVDAMRLLFDEAKLVVEPSGATALAAVMAGRVPEARSIGVTVSGGNVDRVAFGNFINGT